MTAEHSKAIVRCSCCEGERVCSSLPELYTVAASALSGRVLALVRHLVSHGPVSLGHLSLNGDPKLNPRGGDLSYDYVRVMVSHAHREMTKTMAGITVVISTKLREDRTPMLFLYAHPDSGWSSLSGMEPHNAMRDAFMG